MSPTTSSCILPISRTPSVTFRPGRSKSSLLSGSRCTEVHGGNAFANGHGQAMSGMTSSLTRCPTRTAGIVNGAFLGFLGMESGPFLED
eukprot:scaffold5297_cov374-Prasinococcus_capsulatus_cf.AAC.10